MNTEQAKGTERANRSANWLTVYPAPSTKERQELKQLSDSLGNFPDTKDVVLALSAAIETHQHQGRPLSSNEIALYQKVLDFIAEGLKRGVDEAVSLKLRRLTDATTKAEAQAEGRENTVEKWSFYSGDYRGPMIGEATAEKRLHPHVTASSDLLPKINSQEYIPHESPGDVVQFLMLRLEQLFLAAPNRPIVLVDIGAMYGTTWLELAKVYKEKIMAGQLILIATNLGLSRETIENARRPTNGNPLPANYDELYSAVGSLVHFVTGDTEQLLGMSLPLPNGKTFTITPGSVDLIHENWSLSTHSRSLEKDIVDVADLLGETGLLMTRTHDPKRGGGGLKPDMGNDNYLPTANYQVGHFSRARMSNPVEQYDLQSDFLLRNVTRAMKTAAIDTLTDRGFSIVQNIYHPGDQQEHELNYVFFLGSHALPLQFCTEDGQEISPSRYPQSPKLIDKIRSWLQPLFFSGK